MAEVKENMPVDYTILISGLELELREQIDKMTTHSRDLRAGQTLQQAGYSSIEPRFVTSLIEALEDILENNSTSISDVETSRIKRVVEEASNAFEDEFALVVSMLPENYRTILFSRNGSASSEFQRLRFFLRGYTSDLEQLVAKFEKGEIDALVCREEYLLVALRTRGIPKRVLELSQEIWDAQPELREITWDVVTRWTSLKAMKKRCEALLQASQAA